ncbi:hypothetical protein LINPERHAP2_LOCUS39729 [Linum perenne]
MEWKPLERNNYSSANDSISYQFDPGGWNSRSGRRKFGFSTKLGRIRAAMSGTNSGGDGRKIPARQRGQLA